MADSEQNMVLVAKLVDQVSDKLKEIQKSMIETSAAQKKLHKEGGEGAEKHRRQVELLEKSFDQIKEAANELVKPSFAAIGITAFSLAGAVGAVVESVKALGEQGQALDKVSRRSGLLADKIRQLQGIGLSWGTSIEETNAGLANFGDIMEQTARRAPQAMRMWMSMPGLWKEIGSKLDAIKDPNKRIEKLLDILPHIQNIDQRRRVLQMLGLPENWMYYTEEELKKARAAEEEFTKNHPFAKKIAGEADEAFTKLSRALSGLKDDLGAAFGPAVVEGVEAVNKFLENGDNVKSIKDAFDGFGQIIEQDVKDVKALVELFQKIWNWSPAEWMKQSPEELWKKYHPSNPEPEKAPTPAERDKQIKAIQDAPWTPISYTNGSSSSDKRVETPLYNAMLRALQDWYSALSNGQPGGGGGGFQKASFGDGFGGGGGGGIDNSPMGRAFRAAHGGGGGGDPDAGSGPRPEGMLKGSRRDVAKIMADEFKRAGMSKEGMAGIFANVQDESRFNPTLRHPDQPAYSGEAHYAHGLYQEGGGEWNRYSAWLQKNYPGSDWRDPRLQTRFLAENLKKNYPGTWKRLNSEDRFHAGATFVNEYLKPAAQYRMGRANRYLRGGVGALEQYTGPMDAPRQTDGNLLKDSAKSAASSAPQGSASISVDFANLPRGAKTSANYEGLFKEMKINRGFQLPHEGS